MIMIFLCVLDCRLSQAGDQMFVWAPPQVQASSEDHWERLSSRGPNSLLVLTSGRSSPSEVISGSSKSFIRNHSNRLLGSLVDCWRAVGVQNVEIRHLLLL